MPEKTNKLNIFINIIKAYKYYFIVVGFVVISAVFMTFPSQKPASFSGMMQKADKYYENGKLAFALEEYNKLVRLYPDNYYIHLRLAEIYTEFDEFKKAKIEYIRAIRVQGKEDYKATIALAKIYCDEKNFEIANNIIKDIEDLKNRKARKELGNIYFKWGKHLIKTNRLESIRKFKKAAVHYKQAKSKLANNSLKAIEMLYAEISDSFLKSSKTTEAIEMLKHSISYNDNAFAHYKLAKIYEKYFTLDMAIKEYSSAFKLNSEVAEKNSYTTLLVKKAEILKKAGDLTTSELYYLKAKKLDSSLDVPVNPDKKILFKLVATKVNEDIDRDILIPEIIFKLSNISKNAIDYLRIKVVFIKDDKSFSNKILTIANSKKLLAGDSETYDISIFSAKPVKHVFDDHNLRVQVYISWQSPDKWKLFRNIQIVRNREFVIINE